MAKIILQTEVQAPIERVFDLARNIDLHKVSASKTNEEAIAGKTSGLIEGNKIYSGTYTSSSKQVGLTKGGGMICGAAAAFLLLL